MHYLQRTLTSMGILQLFSEYIGKPASSQSFARGEDALHDVREATIIGPTISTLLLQPFQRSLQLNNNHQLRAQSTRNNRELIEPHNSYR